MFMKTSFATEITEGTERNSGRASVTAAALDADKVGASRR
jgi:hypothetical protein